MKKLLWIPTLIFCAIGFGENEARDRVHIGTGPTNQRPEAASDFAKRLVIISMATPHLPGATLDRDHMRLATTYFNEALENNACPELNGLEVEFKQIPRTESQALKAALEEGIDDSTSVVVLLRLPGWEDQGEHRLQFLDSIGVRFEQKEKELSPAEYQKYSEKYESKKDPSVWVSRKEILKWMGTNKPRFMALVTDSSASRVAGKEGKLDFPVRNSGVLSHSSGCVFFRDLFLQPKGVVDLTASWPRGESDFKESLSWSDANTGGYFMQNFLGPISGVNSAEYVRLPAEKRTGLQKYYRQQIETDGRPGISWEEYFNYVQQKTNDTFLNRQKLIRDANGGGIDDSILQHSRQLPYSFSPLPK